MQRQLIFLAILAAASPVLADKVIHEAYPWPNAEYPSREKPMRRDLSEPLEFGEKYPKPGAAPPARAATVARKPPERAAPPRRTPPDAAARRRTPPDAAGPPPLPERAERAPWWSVRGLIRPHVPAPHTSPAADPPPEVTDEPPETFSWWRFVRAVLSGLAIVGVIVIWLAA